MKKFILVVLNMFLVFYTVMSQETESEKTNFYKTEKGKFYIGYNAGIGQNSNAYRLTSDTEGFSYYEGDTHFTTGLELSYFATGWIRPRLQFRYSGTGYGMYWPDKYADFDKTDVRLSTLNLNLNVDFLVFSKEKFQLFLSPGLVSEFNVSHSYKNYATDGDTSSSSYNIFSEQYRESIAGANFSLIAKYKLNKNFGFVLMPGYNTYFKKYVDANDKNYSKKLLSFGVEYTF